MDNKDKITAFMVLRNSVVMRAGIAEGKTLDEINCMAYAALQEVEKIINYEKASEAFQKGKELFEDKERKGTKQ